MILSNTCLIIFIINWKVDIYLLEYHRHCNFIFYFLLFRLVITIYPLIKFLLPYIKGHYPTSWSNYCFYLYIVSSIPEPNKIYPPPTWDFWAVLEAKFVFKTLSQCKDISNTANQRKIAKFQCNVNNATKSKTYSKKQEIVKFVCIPNK